MAFKNTHYGVRMSAKKIRPVINLVRGKKADDALTRLGLCNKRAAVFIRQALAAAIANADQAEAEVRRLIVVDARVDQGATIKRWHPKDRGRAHPIRKRTSHITIAVDVG